MNHKPLPLQRELDALADADRAAAPPGLADRVASASLLALQAGPTSDLFPAPEPKPLRLASSRRFFTPMRLAAGFALLVTLASAYLASFVPGSGTPALAASTDAEHLAVLCDWLASFSRNEAKGGVTLA